MLEIIDMIFRCIGIILLLLCIPMIAVLANNIGKF